ncbi:terminase, partial [Mycobacteroides abscessus subsp. abscessus]
MCGPRPPPYVARVGLDDDGKPVAGISADRSGTDWVIPWLVEHQDGFAAVVMQSNGAPVTSLIEDAKAEGLNVIEWGGADLGIATWVCSLTP